MATVSVHVTLASICNMDVLENNQDTSQGNSNHGYLLICCIFDMDRCVFSMQSRKMCSMPIVPIV
jgi:hypothetical protein